MSRSTRGQIGLGIGGHHQPHRGQNDEWLTPPGIVEALAPFDLDPCSPVNRPWDTATRHLDVNDNGLVSEWGPDEFVWCNPPYGPETWKWLNRLASHPAGGIALTFARTETVGFFASIWGKADGILFLRGRLHFHYVDGARAKANSGGPSVLVAYGDVAVHRLKTAVEDGQIDGAYVDGWVTS